MKRFFTVLAAVAIAFMATAEARAQGSVGVGYSMNLNKRITPAGKSSDDLHGINFRLGYNFELAYGDWGLLGLESGLLYDFLSSRNGESIHNAMTAAEVSEHYVSVPLFLNYGLDMGTWMPYVYAGPMLSMGLASQVKILYRYMNHSGDESKGNIVIHNYADKVTSKISDDPLKTGEVISKLWQAAGGMGYDRFDVKVGFGAGVRILENTDIRVQYNLGLLNRYSGSKVSGKMLTDQLYVTLGYCF